MVGKCVGGFEGWGLDMYVRAFTHVVTWSLNAPDEMGRVKIRVLYSISLPQQYLCCIFPPSRPICSCIRDHYH